MEFNESLVKGGVTRALIKFAIPVMLANILQIVYLLIDLYILGKFAGKVEVSAATISFQIMSLVTLGLSGLMMGLMVVLGQYYGAKNQRDLAGAVGSGSVFFLIVAAVLTLPFLLLNNQLISVMNTPDEAVSAARGYLFICSCGIVFILGFNVIGNMFRGLGSSKLALVFAAISCVLNIALDLLFIVRLNMGAIGAAYATVIAQGTSLLLAVLYIWRVGLGFKLTRADFRPRAKYIKKIAYIGAPISIQEILVTISFMIITAVASEMGKVDGSTSVGIVERLMGFFTLPTMAMASAVGAMAAHNLGAGHRARAEKCMWSGIVVSLCIALPICAYCVFLGGSKISPIALFADDVGVLRDSALYIKSYVFDAAALAFVFVFNAFFSSCGHSVFAMSHSIAATIAIRAPIVLITSRIAGTTLFHVGIGAPAATIASLAACLIFFFHIKRKATQQRIASVQ